MGLQKQNYLPYNEIKEIIMELPPVNAIGQLPQDNFSQTPWPAVQASLQNMISDALTNQVGGEITAYGREDIYYLQGYIGAMASFVQTEPNSNAAFTSFFQEHVIPAANNLIGADSNMTADSVTAFQTQVQQLFDTYAQPFLTPQDINDGAKNYFLGLYGSMTTFKFDSTPLPQYGVSLALKDFISILPQNSSVSTAINNFLDANYEYARGDSSVEDLLKAVGSTIDILWPGSLNHPWM